MAQAQPMDLNPAIDARDPQAVALLVYTSGTTGPPKGAQLTGYNIISSGAAAMEMFGPQDGKNPVQLSAPCPHMGTDKCAVSAFVSKNDCLLC